MDRSDDERRIAGRVVRLLTLVDLEEDNARAGTLSFSAVLSAVLDDGRRIVLLDDRGWTQSVMLYSDRKLPREALDAVGRRQRWLSVTAESVEEHARSVVGPDEPYGEYSPVVMAEAHWSFLARVLDDEGIAIDPAVLGSLPHDVELSDALSARIAAARPGD